MKSFSPLCCQPCCADMASASEPYMSFAVRRSTQPRTDGVTSITYSGLVNFTNKDPSGPSSGNCLINSLVYDESAPLQETIGEVTQLEVDNIDQHPYHHHIQPCAPLCSPDYVISMPQSFMGGGQACLMYGVMSYTGVIMHLASICTVRTS